MLYGIDISHYQGHIGTQISAARFRVERGSNPDFVIAKATEGVGWIDKEFTANINAAKDLKMLVGAYHYARPETGNTPESEAEHFVSVVKPYIGEIMLALDWEGEAHNCPVAWARQWLDKVFELTGVRPLVYLNYSRVKNGQYDDLARGNYGLWCARWSSEEPKSLGAWGFKALWQFRGSPLDLDIFYGDENAFLKYCTPISKPDEKLDGEKTPDFNFGSHSCGCCCMKDSVE